MPFAPFHEMFPYIAERQTRVITVLPESNLRLPPGNYVFLEMFCDEPRCDCRRVFFSVVTSHRKAAEAVVAWGWEEPAFYAQWMKSDEPRLIAGLVGPILNPGSPQSRLAPGILYLVKKVLITDPAYVKRLKRHYRLFRDRIEGQRGRSIQETETETETETEWRV